MAASFQTHPRGPADLAEQKRFFGGWPELPGDPGALAMAFPVEGWSTSAAVVVRQAADGSVHGEVHGAAGPEAERAWQQALCILSLDIDGSGFRDLGERDPVLGRVAATYRWLRPTLFHSPYEAACNFVIGQRISIAQARALRLRMAAESGAPVSVAGTVLHAFPSPQALLELATVRGLPDEKVTRLHGIARAALDGVLDRAHLRALPTDAALAELSGLPGVGHFSSQGILFRGAGVVDELTDDDVSKQAVERLYGLDHRPTLDEVQRLAEAWRPYRMWATVLLHVWLRSEGGGPEPRRRGR